VALRDYLAVLRRRKWLAGQAVLLVTVGSVLFSLDQEKLYQASAKVLLSRQNLANSLTGTQDPTLYVQADRIAQTQADVARVATVADRVLRAVPAGSLTVSQFLSRSSVSTAQNADMLTFHVTNHDPGLARRLVDAYAREYTIYRRQLDTASFQRARQSVHARMRTLERAGRQSSPLYARLVDRDEQLATMEALQTSNAYVVQSATKAVQVQPRTVRNGLLGLAFGIVLGIALAFLWEALDTRVRSAEEIGQRLGGLPLLARLAEPARNLRSKNLLATLAEPGGTGAEAFRMLRTNLEFVRLGRGVDSIMVTSAVEQEGKSTTIANLAVSLARSGLRVALVDLDLRRPWLHRYFAIEGPGLTEVALGRATLEQALVSIAVTGPTSQPVEAVVNGSGNGAMRGLLQVLSAGVIPPDPGEFVGTDVLTDILGRLREKADLLLIDAPPALQVGDALTLSTKVDGVIVVTRMNVVRRHMLSELARLLAQTPAEKLGFVITAAQEEADAGYGYGYADYGYAARPDAAPHKVAS
jgi:succinoglycan biosynthesis transport protein ExoP